MEDRQVIAAIQADAPAESTNGVVNGQSNGTSNGHAVLAMAAATTVDVAESEVVAQQLAFTAEAASLQGSSTNLFDMCPQCQTVSFAYEEGCKKCYSCGYSEC